MSMFDIQDSKDVHLARNKTSGSDFLHARKVENLEAVENEAAISESGEAPRRWAWFRDHIAVAVIGALLFILVMGVLILFFPSIKSHLP